MARIDKSEPCPPDLSIRREQIGFDWPEPMKDARNKKLPVYKYKSFEDAEKALWNFYPDENYFRQVMELRDMANKLCSVSYPRGVFKYKTIEAANKQREEWELIHALGRIYNLGEQSRRDD
ncbi:hypothetical protein QUF80_15240 [Desulfococcaceae bacterium HSG8]|nr:hypothetical protein [Desulfococcaceae bacterium HSG8]